MHQRAGRGGGGGSHGALYELPTKLRVRLLMQDYSATLMAYTERSSNALLKEAVVLPLR